MKPLSKFSKLILTFGFIISMINLSSYFFPSFYRHTFATLDNLNLFNQVAGVITSVTFISVLVRIWKSKILESTTKTKWSVLLILLHGVFGLFFVWFLDHKGNIR